MNVKRAFVAAAATSLMVAAQAAVQTNPSEVTFQRQDESRLLELEANGEPVPAGAVNGFDFLVGEHTYEHMMSMEPRDGAVVLRPTDMLEVGSYLMVIKTDYGNARVQVYAPLSELPNTLEKQADALGISVQELKERAGLVTELPVKMVDVQLPAIYYVGQVVRLEMPKREGHTYQWTVNGEIVASGPDANALHYTVREAGPLIVQFSERSGEKMLIASAAASAMAAKQPPVEVAVDEGQPLMLQAPQGFNSHQWRHGDATLGRDAVLKHVFEEPGEYKIELRASDSVGRDDLEFVDQTYHVTVTADGE
jgi:hypothetical protein